MSTQSIFQDLTRTLLAKNEELVAKQGLETISFYGNGPFMDMCEGPHVENTSQIPISRTKTTI